MNEQTTIQELKSERVQKPELKKRLPRPDDSAGSGLALSRSRMLERLKSERVQSRLKRMPGWKTSGGKSIDRVREFPDTLVAASYLAFAALLARQAGQPLRVSMVGNAVVVALPGRANRPGLTEEMLDLAEQLG